MNLNDAHTKRVHLSPVCFHCSFEVNKQTNKQCYLHTRQCNSSINFFQFLSTFFHYLSYTNSFCWCLLLKLTLQTNKHSNSPVQVSEWKAASKQEMLSLVQFDVNKSTGNVFFLNVCLLAKCGIANNNNNNFESR